MHVLKICDKKGSKPIKEIKSQHITGIEIHSEDISDENKLTFKVSSSDMKKPLCLYSKTHEEISNWVASLLVTVSKGMKWSYIHNEYTYVHMWPGWENVHSSHIQFSHSRIHKR